MGPSLIARIGGFCQCYNFPYYDINHLANKKKVRNNVRKPISFEIQCTNVITILNLIKIVIIGDSTKEN